MKVIFYIVEEKQFDNYSKTIAYVENENVAKAICQDRPNRRYYQKVETEIDEEQEEIK